MQPGRTYRYAAPVYPVRRRGAGRPRPGQAQNRLALAAGGLTLLAYLGAAALLVLFYGYFALSNAVVPGVAVGRTALGGLTPERAAATLRTAWDDQASIVITDGVRSWNVSPGGLGFALDAPATAEEAARVGRNESGWPLPGALLGLASGPVVPVARFDPAMARAHLAAAAEQINLPALEATVAFQEGRWVAAPGQMGAQVDLDATVAAWAADPAGWLVAGRLPLVMRAVAPTVMDTSALATELEALFETGLLIQLYDPVVSEVIDWRVSSTDLAAWVRVQEGAGGPRISLERAGLERYLQSRQGELGGRTIGEIRGLDDLAHTWQNGRAVTVLLRHPASSHMVQPGEQLIAISMKVGVPYWMIVQANPGINPDGLVPGQVVNIPSPDELLPLPVVLNKRIVISISQQRLWAYESGRLRSESVISTGIARSPTMPGVFQVRTHEINAYASLWDLWMPHFLGIYEAAPGFMNGIHGLPLLSGGRRLWADALGSPASYGCVILTLAEAEDLYNWAEEGTVVEIKP